MNKINHVTDEISQGRVVGCLGGLYEVETVDNARVFCHARGAFRHEETRVLVGDIVTLEYLADGSVVINEIAKRKNSLIRPRLANLDHLTAVLAAKNPLPMPDTLDKLLAICAHNGIDASIVLTKCDLTDGHAPTIDADCPPIDEVYRLAGYPVFCLSSMTGEGIEKYESFIRGKLRDGNTVAFAGASGVGKSTLLNRLFPHINCETGSVSEKINRGRHTTRAVTLFSTDGGFVADTPGFSMLDFIRFDFFSLDELPLAFPEIVARIGECRYADCSHTSEEGCAVIEALKAGKIAPSRHRSYVALYDILRKKQRDIYK